MGHTSALTVDEFVCTWQQLRPEETSWAPTGVMFTSLIIFGDVGFEKGNQTPTISQT